MWGRLWEALGKSWEARQEVVGRPWHSGKAVPVNPEVLPQDLLPSPPTPTRKGEGAFRLRPREPLPPRPLDKYELRETKRRLQQGPDRSCRQGPLGPRACAHLSPLHRDPFCGEPPRPTPLSAGHLPCPFLSSGPWAPSPRPCSPAPRVSPPSPGPPQLPASPCAPCPAALAPTPRPSGSSGCLSPSSGRAPGGADAPSPGGPLRSPSSVQPASPCTSGEAVALAAACEQKPWWPWAQPPKPTGPLSRIGTGPGVMGCLTWCAWI